MVVIKDLNHECDFWVILESQLPWSLRCIRAVQGAWYWDNLVQKLCNALKYSLGLSVAWLSFQFFQCRSGVHLSLSSWDPVAMETESEQNSNSTSGSSSSGGSTRPQISQMSLYERQAVQVRHGCALGWQGIAARWCWGLLCSSALLGVKGGLGSVYILFRCRNTYARPDVLFL